MVPRVHEHQRLAKIDIFPDFLNGGNPDREINRVTCLLTPAAEQD